MTRHLEHSALMGVVSVLSYACMCVLARVHVRVRVCGCLSVNAVATHQHQVGGQPPSPPPSTMHSADWSGPPAVAIARCAPGAVTPFLNFPTSTNGVLVAMWVNTASTPGDRYLFSFGTPDQPRSLVIAMTAANRFHVTMAGFSWTSNVVFGDLVSNNWWHLAVAYIPSTQQLVISVDGSSRDNYSGPEVATFASATGCLAIGREMVSCSLSPAAITVSSGADACVVHVCEGRSAWGWGELLLHSPC